MIERFTVKRVNQMREKLAAARATAGQSLQSDGWHKSDLSPEMLLDTFNCLWLKDGYVLRAYIYKAGENGNGIVWAMPSDSSYPEPSECTKLTDQFLEPPKPEHALDDFMEAIDGDRSEWSYMCASILHRELEEFGARWHGCNWSDQKIISMKSSPPSVWSKSPCVIIDDIKLSCYYHTISEQSGLLIQNQYDFEAESYSHVLSMNEIESTGSGFLY